MVMEQIKMEKKTIAQDRLGIQPPPRPFQYCSLQIIYFGFP